MNPAPHTQLDTFISDTLKRSDENFQPIDWSEVEVLLKHEQRSIPVKINISRKNLLISAASAGILILLFAIFKIASNYSSVPSDAKADSDSTQSGFSIIDTANTTAPNVVVNTDTLGIDSITSKEISKIDSGISVTTVDPASEKKIIPKEIAPAEKKKKKDTAQNATDVPLINPGSIMLDTSTVFAPKEEIESPAVPDTANKKSSPENGVGKKKKSKPRKSSPPSESNAPAETKPDSLNQQ